MSGEYVGAVNGDGRPHGGTYKVRWRNGDVYIGEWNDGIKHGQGTYKCAYGVYIGKWNVGNMHGQGTFMIDDVVVYDGDWKDGKMVGNAPEGKVNITINGVVKKVDIELAVHALTEVVKEGVIFFLQRRLINVCQQ
jgi:hypothetical protein